ncbi:hypothetical protein BKA61DRAFT_692164 [Leptodontidium sp. MPI-SDFR-AT-0119]|nr:hypothetical protein BKA61DRAFT_692164 [Leptodontidium sp. MPI-SDFR-AT-0119]
MAESKIPIPRDFTKEIKTCQDTYLVDIQFWLDKGVGQERVTVYRASDAVMKDTNVATNPNFHCHFLFTLDLQAKGKAPTDYLTLYDRERIDILVSIAGMCIIVALLVIPVYLLWSLTTADKTVSSRSTSLSLAVLSICTMIFSLVLSYFTRAKRHEILASTAAWVILLEFVAETKLLTCR